ncbi:MAG: DNA polymerase IV [Fibrobacterota bacterium]
MLRPRAILHIDMDCFFAAIETRDNPALIGRPVIVGAQPGTRGVISACNYEARKFGLHSAMPISRAFRLCPKGVYLPVDMARYEAVSDQVMAILEHFTDRIEPISVDEAYLDISDLGKLFGVPEQIARKIKVCIREALSLTASIGVAPCKTVAKIAANLNKPDGLLIVLPEEVQALLDPLPVSRLPGVGAVTHEALKKLGIRTVAELRKYPPAVLSKKFGEGVCESLLALARGRDDSAVETVHETKSISREHTFQKDTPDRALLKKSLLALMDDVARRCRAHELKGRTVFLSWREPDFARHSRHRTLVGPTNESNALVRAILGLFESCIPERAPVRLIGAGVMNFGEAEEECQLDLFAKPKAKPDRQAKLDRARDAINKKFGKAALKRACLM